MKTYLKRAQENPSTSIFYASGDIPGQSLSRDYLRHRIVQPSTKEQQRLLSSSSSARLQHVHWGKYGIKPLWPSEKSSCEQWQEERKTNEVRTVYWQIREKCRRALDQQREHQVSRVKHYEGDKDGWFVWPRSSISIDCRSVTVHLIFLQGTSLDDEWTARVDIHPDSMVCSFFLSSETRTSESVRLAFACPDQTGSSRCISRADMLIWILMINREKLCHI